jgi:hypothetical protein
MGRTSCHYPQNITASIQISPGLMGRAAGVANNFAARREASPGSRTSIRSLLQARKERDRTSGDRETQTADVLADFRISTLPVDLIGFFIHARIYRRKGDNLRFFHDSFESYLSANALEAEFWEQQFDMIRQCSGNLRLVEMWISCSSFSRPSLTGVASKKFWLMSSRWLVVRRANGLNQLIRVVG